MRKDRKLFKKSFAVLLAAAMAMSSTMVPAFADETENIVAEQSVGEDLQDSTIEFIDEEDSSSTIDEISEETDSEVTDSEIVDSEVTDSEITDSELTESEEEVELEEDLVSDNEEKRFGTSEEINAEGTVDMFRIYFPGTGEHLYTKSKNETVYNRDRGWHYEGIAWVSPTSSDVPIYRLYHEQSGEHLYTVDENEKNVLSSGSWKYEGIGWYSAGKDGIPVYRLFNPRAKAMNHHYTTDANEKNVLLSQGWVDEGIGWYALEKGKGKSYDVIPPQTVYKGIDYSDIYDFNYYITANADAKARFGKTEDEKAIEYFVNTAMWNGVQAKQGVTYTSTAYRNHRYKFDATLKEADRYTSSTGYCITVNRTTHMVRVYQGKQYTWKQIYSTSCTIGAAATPTYTGVFKTRLGGYYFDSGSVRCFYYTPFNGGIYFHSVLYAKTSTPQVIMDGRLGYNISHGCVRLPINSAYWIYQRFATRGSNVGTTVAVFDA